MYLDGATFSDGIDFLVRLALDVDARFITADGGGDVADHRLLVRADLRQLADHGDVDVHEPPAMLTYLSCRGLEEDLRILPLVPGVIVRKELADVRSTDRPEQGIRHRMEHDVSVTVAYRADGVLDVDASKNERSPLAGRRRGFQAVQVIAMPDAEWCHG